VDNSFIVFYVFQWNFFPQIKTRMAEGYQRVFMKPTSGVFLFEPFQYVGVYRSSECEDLQDRLPECGVLNEIIR